MEENKKKCVEWVILNLIVPLAPVVIKLAILFLGKDGILKTNIIESAELIYYNLFICIIFLNIINKKKETKIIEVVLENAFKIICVIDLIMIILIYLENQSKKVTYIAVILTVIIPVFVAVYYCNEVIGEEKNDK